MPSFYSYSFRTSRMAFDQFAGSGALVASTYNRWQCFQYSSNHATTNAIIGEIGNNTLHNNEISLYIGIDHPDVPLAQLGSNGLTINSISDISNYKIHVKTWCNYFDKYTTAGLMLGSDLRDQGDVNMAPSNYSSNPNGFNFLNPNTVGPNYFIKINSNGSYLPLNSTLNYSLYSNIISNLSFNINNSNHDNYCENTSGYRPVGNQFSKDLINSLIVFPNPFETDLRIESSMFLIKDIMILDVLGRSVFRHDLIYDNDYTIIFNRAPGCYLLKVVLANGEITYYKIVKSHD